MLIAKSKCHLFFYFGGYEALVFFDIFDLFAAFGLM